MHKNTPQPTTPITRHFPDSDALNKYVVSISGKRCLLSFSRGKDSLCAWLQLRKYFDEVVVYWMYTIPGLSFEEESIQYYEKFFGVHIYRVLHPALYRMLNAFMYQTPERRSVIESLRLPYYEPDDIDDILRHDLDMPGCYMASGIRAADSVTRYTAIKTNGPLNPARLSFFPVFDWKAEDMEKTIRAANVRLPIDYQWFGRTFCGLDFRFISVIKRERPEDYRRILEWFPLVEAELKRYEYKKEHV